MYDGAPNQWTQIKTSGFGTRLREIYAGGEELFALTDAHNFFQYKP